MKVGAVTGGRLVPSARFRVRQYMAPLKRHGIALSEFEAHTSCYPPRAGYIRPFWGALRLAEMGLAAHWTRQFDVTLMQREMVSTFATLESFTRSPRVLDVDDAIHLLRGGQAARKLAQLSERVICGNGHLAEIYRQWNSDVVVLPTPVDTDKYTPVEAVAEKPELVLGWIGTSANLQYLQAIEGALSVVLSKHPHALLKVVCDRPPEFKTLSLEQVRHVPWREETEVELIQSFDVGLMPLADSPWARAKCSFKMLQYMSCGLPVVVSPVGMNAEVLSQAAIGFAAMGDDEWIGRLDELLSQATLRATLGRAGRTLAVSDFSLSSLAPRLAQFLGVVEVPQ
jgi:glycosyltransferase involved in cell wall biosynthesis